jgi:virginiamycin B lyase
MRFEHTRLKKTRMLVLVLCLIFVFAISLDSAGGRSPIFTQDGPPSYIEEYHVPTPKSAPLAITVDQNGVVWFTESNATKLARFDPVSKDFSEYQVPWVGDMWGAIADPRGYVWFTQYSGKGSVNPGGAIVEGGIGRIVRFGIASKNFTSTPIPTNGSFPMRLALDPQGRIWFTEFLGNKIGVYDPSLNRLHEYPIPTNSSGPTGITFDRHGVLWFSESYSRKLGMFNPQNQSFTEYSLGAATASQIVSSPVGVAVDREGDVWAADHGGNWIVKFDPSTQKTVKYTTHFPPEDVYPISLVNDLLIDSRGRVWFAEHGGNSIGYYEPETRMMVEFPIPTGPISTALWMALAPNGDIWFAEWSGNNIGVVHSDYQLPISVSTPFSSLTLSEGQQATIPLQIRILGDITGNGNLSYAFGSYNPNDASGTLSPQSTPLSSSSEISAQAQLRISHTLEPGSYSLALGIETKSVNVWSLVSIEVVKSTPSNMPLLIGLVALTGVSAFLILVVVLQRHGRLHRTS